MVHKMPNYKNDKEKKKVVPADVGLGHQFNSDKNVNHTGRVGWWVLLDIVSRYYVITHCYPTQPLRFFYEKLFNNVMLNG